MMKAHLLLIAYFVIALSTAFVAADASDDSDIINPNWVKPGWKRSRQHNAPAEGCPVPEECKCPDVVVPECPMPDATEEAAAQEEHRNALVFYRKFVRRVFEERRLEAHPSDGGFRVRNVQFKISDQQVERLQKSRTATEIDAVVTEIVEQSEGSVYHAMAESLCGSLISLYANVVQSYWVIPVVSILLILFLGKVLRLRLWLLIPLLALMMSYTIQYHDCNNRLELEKITTLMKSENERNPCGKYSPTRWYDWWSQKDSEAKCIEHLRSTYGLKRDFCDPSEVFIEMVAKLQLKYFEAFIHRMVSVFKSSTASSGYIESVLISMFILLLIYLLIKYGSKYFLYASGGLVADVVTRGRPREADSVHGAVQQAPPQLPLTVNINFTKPRRVNSVIEPTPSRVEDIKEAAKPIAALPAPTPTVAAKSSPNVAAADGSGDGPGEKVVEKSPSNVAAAAADGSGDGPVKVVHQPEQPEDCDGSSGDESIVILKYDSSDDGPEHVVPGRQSRKAAALLQID